MPSDSPHEEAHGLTFADVAMQADVLAYVIDSAPKPVLLQELPVLLFEGRFTPEEGTRTQRAAEWLIEAQLLERKGDALMPAGPPTGLARAIKRDGPGGP